MEEIEEIIFISPLPTDSKSSWSDVGVRLKNHSNLYVFEFITPEALTTYMENEKKKFFEPNFPFIIVEEVTISIIKEALEEFLIDDGFWFKLYAVIPKVNFDDLNIIEENYRKRKNLEKLEGED